MSSISIRRLTEPRAVEPMFREMDDLFEQVRNKAFERFLSRGEGEGDEKRDWLEAERELLYSPPLDLFEDDRNFQVRIAVPGFDAKEVHLSVLPDAIILEAEAKKNGQMADQKKNGSFHIQELSARRLFRRIDVPCLIDIDKVTAKLDNGVLHVTAPKSTTAKRDVAVATAG